MLIQTQVISSFCGENAIVVFFFLSLTKVSFCFLFLSSFPTFFHLFLHRCFTKTLHQSLKSTNAAAKTMKELPSPTPPDWRGLWRSPPHSLPLPSLHPSPHPFHSTPSPPSLTASTAHLHRLHNLTSICSLHSLASVCLSLSCHSHVFTLLSYLVLFTVYTRRSL